jgi:hypothetical protein
MTINLVSPGISIREVDLTLGRVDTTTQIVGAIAGPFEKGPVGEPILINSEAELLEIFGPPKDIDDQNEYWLSASDYLSYGAALRVIRADASSSTPLALTNANSTSVTGGFLSELKIKSDTDYELGNIGSSSWTFSSRNPGSWANEVKVCVIDNRADQIIEGVGASNTLVQDEIGVLSQITLEDIEIDANTTVISGINTSGITLSPQMYVQSIPGVLLQDTRIVSIGSGSIILENSTVNEDAEIATLNIGIQTSIQTSIAFDVVIGMGVTQSIAGRSFPNNDGGVSVASGYLRGIVTEINESEISVKVTDIVDGSGKSHPVDYQNSGTGGYININSFTKSSLSGSTPPLYFGNTEVSTSLVNIVDWYGKQNIVVGANKVINWSSIAAKPKTSQYALEKDAKNDELHIVVIDGSGKVSGISGQILEKHLFISKASDGKVSPSRPVFYRDFIFSNSKLIFAESPDTNDLEFVDIEVDSSNSSNFALKGADWGRLAQGSTFKCVGSVEYTLNGGKDYSTVGGGEPFIGGYSINNSSIISAYKLLENEITSRIDFIICGPSGGQTIFEAQSKANALIAIAEKRKDCIVSISPYKADIVSGSSIRNSREQTERMINFFSGLTSSSYAVFNSGYKYTLDRFNNKFIYVSCSADIAGIMARTAINNFPWFSPAGNSRGAMNNVIKLAYNPSAAQRDVLYENRINAVISSPGSGTILYGDKTALSYSSAFDRINVRMLFLALEKSIEAAARAQLFEFNDIITRNNFINIVEPYLRDVTSKRGITEFLLICDESNNTAEVIDANEFKADIFVKPARSINFIGLIFVATRTGISFSEVVGTV